MEQDHGRVPDGTGLSQAEPQEGLGPSGFDPSRIPSRTIALDDLTPGELATLFAHMASDDQAHFFNKVGAITRNWPGTGWCMQCAHIVDCLSDEGAKVVLTLAGHIRPDSATSAIDRAIDALSDSDGSPKGGDGVAGSVDDDSAGRSESEGIAR
jgi:hypothetical protein